MQEERPTYAFGPFVLRPDTGDLWNAGRRVKLAPQPFQVLALIVTRAGELVSREEVRNAVWADGTTVEFDQGLNYCLRQIRIALHDDARRPVYIETVPKRGYRLLVPVVRLPTAAAADQPVQPADAMAPDSPAVAPPPSPWWHRGAALGAAALVVLGAWWASAGRPASPMISAKADRLFQEAQHLAGSWELDKVIAATTRYQEVIRLEPRFAPAWAGLTNAEIVLSFLGDDPEQARADSEVHAKQALALDASSAAAHAALGHSYWHQWRWREGGEALHRAVELDGNDPVAHQLYGLYLASVGRKTEAVSHARRAVDLAPLSGLFNYSLAQVYLQTGDFESALHQANRTLQIHRHFPLAFHTLVRANVQLGRLEAAVDAVHTGQRVTSSGALEMWHAYLLAVRGDHAAAQAILATRRQRQGRPGASIAEAAARVALGDIDAAFEVIDRAIEARVPGLLWLQTTAELGPLRADPRFPALAARMNLK